MKILLIRNDNIGDLVCSTPCFEALRKKYPKAQIDIVVNSLNAPVVIGRENKNPYLDKIWVYTKTKHKKGIYAKTNAFLHKAWILFCLFKERYDVVIMLRIEPSKYSALFAKCARGKVCYGAGSKEDLRTKGIPNFCETPITSIHEVMVCFDILAPLGVEYEGEETAYAYPYAFKSQIPYILFHISSRRLKDNPYPLESLQEIIKALPFVIVIGDSEDKLRCKTLAKLENCEYKDTKTLDEVAALARGALLTLAFEGGVAHIFGACNTKAITIFDKVNIARWGTWGHFETCLQTKSQRASDVKPQIIIEKILDMLK
ncbi:glycosyltransferase family 9 protein [Helicobacter mesocricetorum]|uniref:glycosyltransferase family 9 protein n=1 Tax=Helicobacter mesocricetorum TaxID=87012 RepID=UPI0013154535|nr:glycosyltransferase family 9 protein [Helicobacter mesocricetorum]